MFKFQFEEPEPAPEQHDVGPSPSELVPAQAHSVDLLKNNASRISYTVDRHGIPRRDLFDVRFQLMREDNIGSEERILLEGNEDVRKSVYEGGLKVWEGANDLVEVLDSTNRATDGATAGTVARNVLELGCGAGVPTCSLLHRAIVNKTPGRFVFADYNSAVLRLLTMPNVVLAWLSATNALNVEEQSGEVELTTETIDRMLGDLRSRNISLDFISGAWSKQFSDIVGGPFDLVLASETIYSLDSLPAFTDVLVRAVGQKKGYALVAAKKVYFGVGGGIVEFTRLLDERNISHQIVLEKGNVGRVVVKVN